MLASASFLLDKTLVTFEVSYAAKKHLGEISDEKIVKEVFDQFVSIGMAEKKDFIKVFSIFSGYFEST